MNRAFLLGLLLAPGCGSARPFVEFTERMTLTSNSDLALVPQSEPIGDRRPLNPHGFCLLGLDGSFHYDTPWSRGLDGHGCEIPLGSIAAVAFLQFTDDGETFRTSLIWEPR